MAPGTWFPIGIAGFCWIISGWFIWTSLIFCLDSFWRFNLLLVVLTLLPYCIGGRDPLERNAKAPTPPTANILGINIPTIAPVERPLLEEV